MGVRRRSMRRVRYRVAASLDGFIAGRNGEFDWIVMDPEIDFAALMAEFDTLLMGRHTFELVEKSGRGFMGMKAVVFSRTLRSSEHTHVTGQRKRSRSGARAPRETGQGHLALRRWAALLKPRACKPGGYG